MYSYHDTCRECALLGAGALGEGAEGGGAGGSNFPVDEHNY